MEVHLEGKEYQVHGVGSMAWLYSCDIRTAQILYSISDMTRSSLLLLHPPPLPPISFPLSLSIPHSVTQPKGLFSEMKCQMADRRHSFIHVILALLTYSTQSPVFPLLLHSSLPVVCSGAISVAIHMVSPQSKGLFTSAVGSNGAATILQMQSQVHIRWLQWEIAMRMEWNETNAPVHLSEVCVIYGV